MAKHKIASRDVLMRKGDFWHEGKPLTESDEQLLQIIRDRAEELGYTPIVADVRESGRIKGRFRCWKDAIKAAGLPSEKDPEQVAKRMSAREKNNQ